jgi:hypothetical protein
MLMRCPHCRSLAAHPYEVGVAHLRPHASVPLSDPQRDGCVCAANFDNAASMHKHAETVLAIPCASKFIPDVWKTFLQQLMDMHIVKANQSAKVLLGRYVGHVLFAFRPLITIVSLKPGILSQKTF